MVVVSGEELVALVIDVGSHTLRIGYSGDDTPCLIAPSYYGVCGKDGSMVFGEMAFSYPKDGGLDIKPIFTTKPESHELLLDKEGLVGLLQWAIHGRLQTKGSEHPMLLVDNGAWSKELREEIISILFEKLEAPAVFLGRAPVLAAFSTGKHTGLVVDLGAHAASVTPVFDGYVVKSACAGQVLFGGDHLNSQSRAMLDELGLIPNCLSVLPIEVAEREPVNLGATPVYKRKELPVPITASFRSYHEKKILEDFKESILQVAEGSLANEADVAMRPPKYYEFPTGFNRNFGFERFRLGETLFQPNKYSWHPADPSTDQMDVEGPAQGLNTLVIGLSDMVQKAIQNCDVDLRSSVVSNVMLCGGGASIPGLSERLNADLNKMPTFGRVRVQVATTTNERKNAAWIGGSILGSLGSFQQLWLTKQEFQEHGASYIERKSP